MNDAHQSRVPSDAAIENLVDTLRGFGRAYSLDMFPPLTKAEQEQMKSLLDRASATMGRHCAKFMGQAADMIEALHASQQAHVLASDTEPSGTTGNAILSPFSDSDIVAAETMTDVIGGGLVVVERNAAGDLAPTFIGRLFVDTLAGQVINRAQDAAPQQFPPLMRVVYHPDNKKDRS